MQSLKEAYPLRLIIGQEDATHLLDNGATFSNVDSGGFEAASFNVPKDMPSILRGQYVRLDCGLHVAFEGRIQQVQRSLGNRTALQCQGFGALLADASGSMVFVDRDLARWASPSYTRQAALASANKQLAGAQVAADPTSNTPALIQSITDSWVSPQQPINESWYDAGPENLLANIYYDLTIGGNESGADSAWSETITLSSDANTTTTEISSNLHSATEQTGYFAPATAYRFAFLQHLYTTTPAGAQGNTYNAYWRNLAAYGNHGLAGRGSDPVGFYPSDIFSWVVAQVPGLQAGVIQTADSSGYIIPHSAYYAPVTLDQIAADMGKTQGWHWGVWPSPSPLTGDPRPRVDFRPRPAAGQFTAFCMRSDCETLDITEDLSEQFNQCVVTYTQVDGTSGAVTVTADNPILDAAGITSRTLELNGGTMTPATAALFGAEALTITNSQARVSGTADIIAPIGGPSAPMPAWLLKAGIDRLRIGDAPSVDAFGSMSDYPIKRVECTLGSSGFVTNVEVGAGSSLVETIQARLQAATTLVGNGGA